MNNKINCLYCDKDEKLDNLMIKVCELNVSTLYLFKEQSHEGRCVVAYNKHVNELFELEDKELELFMKDVTKAAAAIKKAFSPKKVNYGAYSDTLPHLHFHVVPKYENGYSWGGVFEMNPQKTYLSDEEYSKRISMIKENL
jgi:diadenosine tetraphosphate (Ap4A) HIT family hydrolase